MHIHVLELKEILLVLKAFIKTNHNRITVIYHITTTIQCINKMGTSCSMERHHQILTIWEWAISHENYLSEAHIPGKLNTVPEKFMLILNGFPNQSF